MPRAKFVGTLRDKWVGVLLHPVQQNYKSKHTLAFFCKGNIGCIYIADLCFI